MSKIDLEVLYKQVNDIRRNDFYLYCYLKNSYQEFEEFLGRAAFSRNNGFETVLGYNRVERQQRVSLPSEVQTRLSEAFLIYIDYNILKGEYSPNNEIDFLNHELFSESAGEKETK